jgi:predicted DNA-binding transcriptional regulator AlpA
MKSTRQTVLPKRINKINKRRMGQKALGWPISEIEA